MSPVVRALVALAFVAGCGPAPSPPPDRPTGTGTAGVEVDDLLRALPDWATFSPPLADEDPRPIEDATPEVFEVTGPMSQITDADADGDGVADVEVVEDVVSRCTSVPYTMTKTPERIVMYSPDVELLWPGALVQGRSLRDGLGSLEALPIAQRAPLEVSIPAISSGGNFRLVEQPTQARVASAIGEIVGDAVTADLVTPSTITFEEQTYHSESEFALSLGMSGRYLGFEGSASGRVEESATRTTVTAQFFQKMFEVVVAPPATPGELFSPDFTAERYQEQVDLGRIGDDNLPVYLSNVVYGRMMTFSLTSTASESEIRATLRAAYDGLFVSGSAQLSTRQRAILAESTIAVSSLGGDAEATIAMVRSGDWREYFSSDAPLSSAAPLSYTFRNLGDNAVATVSEATEFTVTTCSARAQGDVFDFLEVAEHEARVDMPIEAHAGDFDGDGYDDVLWNHRSAGTNAFYVGYGGPDGQITLGDALAHPETAPEGGWGNYEVMIGDVDGDGLDDIVWNLLATPNVWYVARFDGRDSVVFDAEDRHETPCCWGDFVRNLADVDGDGKDDLHFTLMIGADPRVYAMVDYTPGTGFVQLPYRDVAYIGLAPVGPADLRLADFDGDGDADLVWRHSYEDTVGGITVEMEAVWWAASTRTDTIHGGPARVWLRGGAPPQVANALMTGPFVSGTADDILLVPPGATGPSVNLITADDQHEGAYSGPGIDDFAQFDRFAGDIDGDGRRDIVWSRRAGPINETVVGFGRVDGLDLGGAPQLHPWPVADWDAYTDPLVLDLDGDGQDDLLWTRAGPVLRVQVGLASSNL